MRSPSLISSSKQAAAAKVGVVKRGPWTAEEDEILADYIKREGEGRWRTLPKKAGLLRCGKSCRLRWMNYLRPSLKRGNITPDEEDLILRLHRLLGNRWSLIAGRIPGRTDNEIKNYWNTHLSKKLISQGIDPRTHKPLNPLDNLSIEKKTTNCCSSEAIQYPNDHHVPFPFNDKGFNIGNEHKIKCGEDGSNSKKVVVLRNSTSIEGILSTDDDEDEDEDEDEDIDIHCCGDESFTLFLNSLINEDMFNCNQLQEQEQDQQQQQQPQPHSDALIYSRELDSSSILKAAATPAGDINQNYTQESMDAAQESRSLALLSDTH